MRRNVAIGVAVFGLVAIAGLGLTPLQAASKADICHFSGHESNVEPQHDFFVEWEGDAFVCGLLGGNVINVSMEGAVNGHGAQLRQGGGVD